MRQRRDIGRKLEGEDDEEKTYCMSDGETSI